MTDRPPRSRRAARRGHGAGGGARRGRLRIYFGASAGVGKTYAMLTAARALRGEGNDVVAGVRRDARPRETEALLEGSRSCRRAQSA